MKIAGFIAAFVIIALLVYFFVIKKPVAPVPAVNGAPHPVDTTPPDTTSPATTSPATTQSAIAKMPVIAAPKKTSSLIPLSPPLANSNASIILYYRFDNYDSSGNLTSSDYYDKNKKIVDLMGGLSTNIHRKGADSNNPLADFHAYFN